MATLFKSAESQSPRPSPTLSQAGQTVSLRGKFAITAAVVINDTFQLLKWPANTVLEGVRLDIDSVDSDAAPAAVLQVGVLNAAGTALVTDTTMIATTGAQSKAGGIFSPTTHIPIRLRPRNVDRYIGVLVQTGPATGVAPTAVTLNRVKWVASTAYASGDYLDLPNGCRMKATTAGVSGVAEPDWDVTNAGTNTDGTVTWTNASVVIGLTVAFRNQNAGA